MFTFKTEADLTAMTAEQRDAYGVEKRNFEASATKQLIEDSISKIEMPKSEISKAQFDELVENVNVIKEQGSKTTKLETIYDVVKANEVNIQKSAKDKGKSFEFVIKADAVRASVVGNPNVMDLPSIGQLATRKLTVYDAFQKVPVGKDNNGVIRYVDWDEATKVRAAAAIAEVGAFPESTAKWATYTLALQKVGVSIPMSEEFVYDSAMFAAEVQTFLQNDVLLKIDTDLINASGVAPNIAGLLTQVGTFTAAASGITDANIYDLIVKVYESISAAGGSKYSPNIALMNIVDINKMKLKKDTQNNYVMPPFATVGGQNVDGISILECNAVTANSMIIGDSNYGKIYEEPGFYVATGYDGADWSTDMMTMKARKRLNLLIRTVDQTGWKKVTSISAALVTLAT
jgi:hypothetical protein